MTVGKDVSALFPDVVNCMQTDNLELKKLVYLYLMNYAKSQPDMAIMAVNTFVKVRIHNQLADPNRLSFFLFVFFILHISQRIALFVVMSKIAIFISSFYDNNFPSRYLFTF